jgi:hypothetical protein
MTEQPNIQTQLGLGDSVYLQLTVDELALVLASSNLPRIVGYEIPADITQPTLEAAGHTLMARGGARLGADGSLVINEDIANIVGKGARWARLITLALKFENDIVEQHWIYMGHGAPVLHSIPGAGIHRFQTIPDGKSMLLALAGLLRIRLRNDAMPGNAEFNLDPKLIDDADAARKANGPEAAYKTLAKANLPDSFARSAAAPTINAVVSVLWATTGKPNTAGKFELTERVVWLWGTPDDNGYWMLFPDRKNRTIQVAPANGRKVISVISDFVAEDTKPAR